MSGRGGAVVRADASDFALGGCEFKPCRCHLTGHMADPLNAAQIMSGHGF